MSLRLKNVIRNCTATLALAKAITVAGFGDSDYRCGLCVPQFCEINMALQCSAPTLKNT